MENQQVPDYLSALMKPDSYPHPVSEVELIQTHISYVLLAGDFVYKFKKPVDFGFLDFSTLEKRRYYCERELALNRRLCPTIYLETVTVNSDGDGFALNGSGRVVEPGVKMARMNQDRMMGRIIETGALSRVHLDGIIEVLVPFYRTADGGESLASYGTAEAVGVNVLENFEQTESFIGQGGLTREQFDLIGTYARTMLAREELFRERIEAGRIRDCHGDLYSANICLDEPIHIFDCIEFNERFRYSDVAADVAFLAMDLDYHGLEELSDYFLHRFAERADDPGCLTLADFYKCYRAYVRGKIGLFTAADPAVPEDAAQSCRLQAKRYFSLAERYARGRNR